jgi:DNA-binding Xre family transcriptional regulator
MANFRIGNMMAQPMPEGVTQQHEIIAVVPAPRRKNSVKTSTKKRTSKLRATEEKNYCLLSVFMFSRQMSVRDLSEQTGISRQNLTALQYGWPLAQKIDLDVVFALCEFFECRQDQLLLRMTPAQAKKIYQSIPQLVLKELRRKLDEPVDIDNSPDLQQII